MINSFEEVPTTSASQTPELDTPTRLTVSHSLYKTDSTETRTVAKSSSDKAVTTRYSPAVAQTVNGVGSTQNMNYIRDTAHPKTTGQVVVVTEPLIRATAGGNVRTDASGEPSQESGGVSPRGGATDLVQMSISAKTDSASNSAFYPCSNGSHLAAKTLLLSVIAKTIMFQIMIL